MLKQRMLNGEKIRGSYVAMGECAVCEVIGHVGYDFIWVDMEHSYLMPKDVLIHANAAKATGTPVFVRVPQQDLTMTKKVMEMGVDGIIFPMIHSAAEAEEMLSHTLYPPYGTRGFGPIRAIRYGKDDVSEYVKQGHIDNLCRFIQIEHISAVEEIEEIAQIPYLDGVFFGPCDLSGSINQLGDVYGKDTTELMEKAIAVLKKYNKIVGVATGSTDLKVLKHWDSMGIPVICSGSDYDFIRIGAEQTLKRLYEAQGIPEKV